MRVCRTVSKDVQVSVSASNLFNRLRVRLEPSLINITFKVNIHAPAREQCEQYRVRVINA